MTSLIVFFKPCEVVSLEVLPEPFDRIEIRTVWRKVKRVDVMPVERLHLVPARVVENEVDLLAFLLWNFLGHRIEKLLEDETVAVGNDQAHELPRPGRDRTDDVAPDMSTVVANAWT